MALATNVWSLITFHPFAHASWTGYTPPLPALPSQVLENVLAVAQMLVFCVDLTGTTAECAFYQGGPPFIFDTSVLSADAAQTTENTTLDNGENWRSVRDPNSGAWLWYSNTTGLVNSLLNPASLAAFIT